MRTSTKRFMWFVILLAAATLCAGIFRIGVYPNSFGGKDALTIVLIMLALLLFIASAVNFCMFVYIRLRRKTEEKKSGDKQDRN